MVLISYWFGVTGCFFYQARVNGDNIGGAGKLHQGICLFSYLKKFFIITGAEAALIVFNGEIGIAKLAR